MMVFVACSKCSYDRRAIFSVISSHRVASYVTVGLIFRLSLSYFSYFMFTEYNNLHVY